MKRMIFVGWVCFGIVFSFLGSVCDASGVPVDPAGLSYTPNSSFVDKDGVLCLFSKANQSIFRWDTFLQQYTNSIPLVDVPEYVAYSADNHTIYLAYDSGLIREISLQDPSYTEKDFANLPAKPIGLSTAGTYVFAVDPSGAWDSHYTFAADGTRIEAVDWNYYSREYIWSEANQKMYFFRDNTSPNDLLWEEINADGSTYPSLPPGAIGIKKDSPLHSSTGFIHPIRVAPDGSVVVLGSGVIHDAETLARLSMKLTNSVADIAWIGDDIYTTRTVDGATQYQQWLSPAFGAGSSTNFFGTANRLIAMDEARLIGISIDAGGGPSFHVLDSDFEEVPRGRGALTLELLQEANEGDGVLSGAMRLAVSTIPTSNLVVNLTTGTGAKFSVPKQLTIPAGENSIDFDLTIFDDALLDGSKGAALRASNPWYKEGLIEVVVHDNETATLSLSLPQTTFEGAGTIAGMVTVSSAPDEDVVVELLSNHPEKIPSSSVVIPAGQTFAPFMLNVIDNNLIDGVQTATVSAQVQNWTSGQASVFIFDNETTALSVQLPVTAMEGDGVLTNAGTVNLAGVATSDIHLTLASSDITEVEVPSSVTISNGQSSVSFDITVMNDADIDGMQSLSILAQAPGFVPGSDSINVQDNELYAFSVDGIATNLPVLEVVTLSLTAENIDGLPMIWFTGSVALVASGDAGAVALSPISTTNFISGTWTGDMAFSNIANNVVLTADDGAGHTGTSMVFNVTGSQIVITPASLTNTQVVADGTVTRSMVISNTGNADLEFLIQGAGKSPVDSNLVTYFPFNGNADDESGNGHNGTVNGATLTIDRFGNADSAYHFDGVNNCISVPDHADFTVTNVTVVAWVKTADKSDYKHITSCYGTDYYSDWYNLKLAASSGVAGWQVDSGGTSTPPKVEGTTDLADGHWHFVVGVRDTSDSQLKIYVDGVLESTVFDSSTGILNPEVDFMIGGRNGSSSIFFNGDIDDVRIYNRALSDVEIQELYTATSSSVTRANGSNLISNGDFEDGNTHFTSTYIYSSMPAVGRYFVGDDSKSWNRFFPETLKDHTSGSSLMLMADGKGVATAAWEQTVNVIAGVDYEFTAWVAGLESRALPVLEFTVDGLVVGTVATENVTWKQFSGSWTSPSSGMITLSIRSVRTEQTGNDFAIDDITFSATETEGEEGLIAAYLFNGNANDESGNDHNGVESGATLTIDRFGNIDSAYHFDGVNNCISVPDHADFTVTNVTVAAWVKTTDKSDYKHITSCYGTDYYSDWYNLKLVASSGVAGWQVDSGGTSTPPKVEGTTDLADGHWHFVVGVRDTSDSQLKIYVDGVLESTVFDSSTGILNPEVDFMIGGRNGSSSMFFNGDIDDVRIYNRALSAEEIMDLYNAEDEANESWLSEDPKFGTIPPGSNAVISVRFNAAGLVAGDYAKDLLKVTSNDPFTSSNSVPASMWVLPPAPTMIVEPAFTEGTSNLVAWNEVDGPVSYLTEVVAITNTAALQQSGWISATNHTFGSLTTNVVYYYHVKASVSSNIGLLEGAWSEWVQSKQVVSVDDLDNDGISDEWEQLHFGGSANCDPLADADGDGQNNRDEFITGMDPKSSDSLFMVRTFDSPADGLFIVSWDSVTGRVYCVDWKDHLPDSFQSLGTNIYHPQNSYTDRVHNVENQGFYRIGVELK